MAQPRVIAQKLTGQVVADRFGRDLGEEGKRMAQLGIHFANQRSLGSEMIEISQMRWHIEPGRLLSPVEFGGFIDWQRTTPQRLYRKIKASRDRNLV